MMQRRPPSGAQAVDKGSLAYLQSRNKNRRMNLLFVLVPIAALVLFSLDCAFLVWLCIGEPISDYLLDILFHVALLVYLIDSVRVAVALRRKQKAAREEIHSGPEL